MARKVTKFPVRANVAGRERVEVELPAFIVRALEARLREANAGATDDDRVDMNHLIELQLAETVTLADAMFLERDLPGFRAALTEWLADAE